jgi:positive regulator of sigma E activity
MKYTQYAYLIAGVILLIDGVMKLNAADKNAYLIMAMGVVAIGLFFFRRKFAKKFEDRNKNQ